jgi:hypothetical protein
VELSTMVIVHCCDDCPFEWLDDAAEERIDARVQEYLQEKKDV